jgi:hypothetical protein
MGWPHFQQRTVIQKYKTYSTERRWGDCPLLKKSGGRLIVVIKKIFFSLLVFLLVLFVEALTVYASPGDWRNDGTDWIYVNWFESLGRPAGVPAGAFNIEIEEDATNDHFIYAASHGGEGIFRRRLDTNWENIGRPGGSSADQFYAVSPARTFGSNTPIVFAGVVSASTGRRGLYLREGAGSWQRVYSAHSVAGVGVTNTIFFSCYFVTTDGRIFAYSELNPLRFIGPISMGTINNSFPLRAFMGDNVTVRHNQNVTTRDYNRSANLWTTINHPPVPDGTAGGTIHEDDFPGIEHLYAINNDGAIFRRDQSINEDPWVRMGQFAGHRNHYRMDNNGFFYRISPDGNNVERGIAVRSPVTPVLLAPATGPPPWFGWEIEIIPDSNVQNPVVRINALTQFRYDGVAYGSTQARWEIQTATDSDFTANVQTQVVAGTANEVTLARTLTEGRWFIRLRVQSNTAQGSNSHWSSWSATRAFDIDLTPPTGSFTINSGAAFTVSPTVTLQLAPTRSSVLIPMSVRYRNAPSGAWTAWESVPSVSRSWVLSSGDGAKTVEIQYRDEAGNISGIISQTITLDTVLPTITANPASRGGGGPVTVDLSFTDATSGVRQSRHAWTDSPTPPGTGWSVWNTTQTAYSVSTSNPGTWHLHVQAQDNAGNTRTQSFGPYQVNQLFSMTELILDEIFYGDPPGTAPRTVNAGAWIRFSVDFSAAAQSVSANTGTGAVALTHQSGNRWAGEFMVPINVADGTVYSLTITAIDAGGTPHTFASVPFISISGNIWSRVRFRFIL